MVFKGPKASIATHNVQALTASSSVRSIKGGRSQIFKQRVSPEEQPSPSPPPPSIFFPSFLTSSSVSETLVDVSDRSEVASTGPRGWSTCSRETDGETRYKSIFRFFFLRGFSAKGYAGRARFAAPPPPRELFLRKPSKQESIWLVFLLLLLLDVVIVLFLLPNGESQIHGSTLVLERTMA